MPERLGATVTQSTYSPPERIGAYVKDHKWIVLLIVGVVLFFVFKK